MLIKLDYDEDEFFKVKDYTRTLILDDGSKLENYQFLAQHEMGMVYIVELDEKNIPTDRMWSILGKDIKNYSNDIKFIEIDEEVYAKVLAIAAVEDEHTNILSNWMELTSKELKDILLKEVKEDYQGVFPGYIYEAASKTTHKLLAGQTEETGSFIIAYNEDVNTDSYLIYVENLDFVDLESLLQYYSIRKSNDNKLTCQGVEFDSALFAITDVEWSESINSLYVKITIGNKIYIYRDVDMKWRFFQDLSLEKAALDENKPSWYNVYDKIAKGEI